jgi:general secretion pathway protein D
MIRDIRDNNGRSYNLPVWKKGLLLFSAIFVFSSILTAGGAITSYAQDQTGNKGIQFNFKDTPIETVLGYLSEAAGLVVISENNLTDRITVISKQTLNVDEAVALINTILQEKGYTAVRTGKNLKIATLSGAKKLTIPIRTGSDPNAVPPSDDVMTYVIPITYAKAATLKDNLTSFLSENAEVGTNADTNTLIITDTANNIRRIMEIVRAIDTHTAAFAEVRVFHLQYADATNTATLITNLFKQSSSSSSNLQGVLQTMTRFGQAGGAQGGPGQGQQATQSTSTQGSSSTSVTAQADDRTNSVVVSAPQDTMTVIEKMVKDLDSDSSQGEAMFVYRLKNGQASNLVTVLKNLFNSATNTTGTTSSSQTTGRVATTVQAAAGPGGVQSMTTSTSSSTGLVGSVYVQADTDTNSLVVMTSPGNYEKVKKMLDELDKPVPQVLIKALIAEVTLDDTIDLGTDFSFLNDWNNTNIQVNSDLSLSTIATGMVANLTGSRWTVQLKALEKEGKLNVLSKPYILATNNQKASITVGSQVPVITDSRTTDTGQTINTVTYEDLGIILTVTPAINDEGLVTMDVTQTISDISATTVQISTGVAAPVFDKRSSTNRVIARDGQTVVIGGLIQNKKSKTYSKIPLLGDIPLLGALFRNADNQKTKTELLIFLTPTVAATDKDLEKISNDKKAENEFLKEKFSTKELEGLVNATPEKGVNGGN